MDDLHLRSTLGMPDEKLRHTTEIRNHLSLSPYYPCIKDFV